jgi:hypothetical protein
MRLRLYGGPADGSTWDQFGGIPEQVVAPEPLVAPLRMNHEPVTAKMQMVIHRYVRVNRTPCYAHHCESDCGWPDAPSLYIAKGDGEFAGPEDVHRYLSYWAESAVRRETCRCGAVNVAVRVVDRDLVWENHLTPEYKHDARRSLMPCPWSGRRWQREEED